MTKLFSLGSVCRLSLACCLPAFAQEEGAATPATDATAANVVRRRQMALKSPRPDDRPAGKPTRTVSHPAR